MSTTSLRNFSLLNARSRTISATPTSQRLRLSGQSSSDIMLVNRSQKTIFVRTGTAAIMADAQAMPILSGEKGAWSRGDTSGRTTHIAVFVESGTADLIILEGLGI